MRGNKKEEQIQKIMLMQEEIKLWIHYVFQQWESKKQEQQNPFPKIAYTETVVFERSEAYQEIKNLSVGMMRDMKTYKREKTVVTNNGSASTYAKHCGDCPRNDTKIFCILI
jgi:hypothetical protein